MLMPSKCPLCQHDLLNSFSEKTSHRVTYLEKTCIQGPKSNKRHHFRCTSMAPALDEIHFLHIQIDVMAYDWHFAKHKLEISTVDKFHSYVNLYISTAEIPWIDIDLSNPLTSISRINKLIPIL